ncbi:hypothetical protein LSTR_LSTR009922 [Laodelphax striatellus]|uniref:Uncharacterized protein n=1 Tax=Laodelphax striatellus TaxID=195883 RepID=A0A482WKB0_LAOST|nr:hypothetical protein LSTR_LSTR009922 [Laodelphax striatellus]
MLKSSIDSLCSKWREELLIVLTWVGCEGYQPSLELLLVNIFEILKSKFLKKAQQLYCNTVVNYLHYLFVFICFMIELALTVVVSTGNDDVTSDDIKKPPGYPSPFDLRR